MHRTEDGGSRSTRTGAELADDYRSTQSGWYLQGVYQFVPRWRVGARYDSLDSGHRTSGWWSTDWRPPPSGAAAATPDRIIADARLESERVLAAARRSTPGTTRATPSDTTSSCVLQYIYGIGAHGAHKF